MANKYLDSTGVKHLWDKIKTWTNSNFQPIGSGGSSFNGGDITNDLNIKNGKSLNVYDPFGFEIASINSAWGIELSNNYSLYIGTPNGATTISLGSNGLTNKSNNGFKFKNDGNVFVSLGSNEILFPNKSGTLATLDDIGSGGGGELPTDPSFDSITLEDTEEGAETYISPYSFSQTWGDRSITFDAESGSLKIDCGSYYGATTIYGDGLAFSKDNKHYIYDFPQKSGTFVVVNEYGNINLTNQNNDNPGYMDLSSNCLYLEEDYYDESGYGFYSSTNAQGHRSNYYDDENDVYVYMNAQNQQFGIEELNYGQSTYYRNGGIDYFNTNGDEYEYAFPNNSGTLVVANEYGAIELKHQYNELFSARLDGAGCSAYYNDDENFQYWNSEVTANTIYNNYYDEYRDITVKLYAEEGKISISDNLNDYTTDYLNGEINYYNGEEDFVFSFPTKSGTLATLDDIQEGGAKIQILTWEDDD